MNQLDCLLVADDLTGACDAAVHFAIRGIRPAAVLFARGSEGRRRTRARGHHGEPRSSAGGNPPRPGGCGRGIPRELRGARLQEDRFHLARQHGARNRRRPGIVPLRCGRRVPGVPQNAPRRGGRISASDQRAGVRSLSMLPRVFSFSRGLPVRTPGRTALRRASRQASASCRWMRTAMMTWIASPRPSYRWAGAFCGRGPRAWPLRWRAVLAKRASPLRRPHAPARRCSASDRITV